MQLFFRRRPRWLRDAFALLAVVVGNSACAVSRPYDAPAAVVLRDGKPCLFAPSPTASANTVGWVYVGVAMIDSVGAAHGVWDLDITAERPATAGQCIPYGMSTQSQNVRLPPASLPDDIRPYRAILGVGVPGTKDRGRFGVWFCYGKDAGGVPRLTRLDGKTLACTNEPLAEPR
jgi:hypothetical protein